MLEKRLTLEGYQDLYVNGQPLLTTEAKHTVRYRIELLEKMVEGRSETVLRQASQIKSQLFSDFQIGR